MLIMIAGASAVFSDEPPGAWPQDSIYPVRKTVAPITVDGVADEAAWEKAPAIPFVYFFGVDQPADEQSTTLKMLWDETNLYLFYDCADQGLTARETERNGYPFWDDCAEIFLRPSADPIGMHFAFEINLYKKPNDIIMINGLYNGTNIAVAGYDPDYEMEVRLNGTLNDDSDVDEGWTMEIAIPLAALRTNWALPKIGEGVEWGFMGVRLNRDVLEGNNRTVSTPFSLMGNRKNLHEPECFGRMRFSGE